MNKFKYQYNFVKYLYTKQAPMGIEGLLKFLQPVVLKEHISSFQFKTGAIDMMSWLYKGCYRCAFELNQNIQSNIFLYYIFQMLDLLFYYKIKPICVFDGRYVGKKEDTIEKRKKSKEENRQKGMDYLKIGNQDQAKKYLSRCIVIDQRIITVTMRALHTKGIDFIVAPYESDSQIAKLCQLGLADFAITEDSDLVVYGTKVVLKLNQDGQCDYIDLDKWTPQDVDSQFLKMFLKMDYNARLESAILSGSDYNHSVKGIGIKRAVKNISIHKTMNNVIQHLRGVKPYNQKVPINYQKEVLDSKLIFLFATTYNPFTQSLEYLNAQRLSEFSKDMSEQDLQGIVGKRYDYNEDMRLGRTNVKTFQKRDIFPIDIKTVFSINTNSLQSKELANRQRRNQYAAARQRRKEELKLIAENGSIQNTIPHSKKKKVVETIVLTEQEKKKLAEARKAERVKRFNDFKQILNNFIIEQSSSDHDNEDSSQSIVEQPIVKPQEEKEQKKVLTASKQKSSEQDAETFSDSESNSCLQLLNPWLKQ